jgi:hypothetical protein
MKYTMPVKYLRFAIGCLLGTPKAAGIVRTALERGLDTGPAKLMAVCEAVDSLITAMEDYFADLDDRKADFRYDVDTSYGKEK